MTNKTPWNQKDSHDELDRELDAALARYILAEPRPGSEERILSNLRAQPVQIEKPIWWRWSLASAAIVLVIAAAVAWRTSMTSIPAGANVPAVETTEEPAQPPFVAPVRKENLTQAASKRRRPKRLAVVVAANPKLDLFPSPRPLSAQEKMALDYVRDFPKEATLVARAQTNLAQQEELERTQPAVASPGIEDQQ